VVKGGTIALQYALKDSYNALYAGSDYRLVVSAAGAGTSPTAAGNYFPVVNGIANVSFADNSTGAGTNVLTITREILANGIWGSSAAVATVNVNVIAAAQTATAVTAAVDTAAAKGSDASKLLPLDVAGTYVSGNTATATNSVTAPSITAGSSTTISGVVTDASGVAVANASVKVELAGAQISSGTAYAIGSLTVAADNSGAYSVTVSTHTAGVQSVKVTSGAATKTVSLYVAAAASTTGTVLTIDAPATVVPGKTVTFTGKLVDKFGNPVATAVTANNATPDFKVVYAGPGFAAQTLPIDTDAAGSFTVSIVTGVADSGSAVLTATYGGSKGAIDATVTGATADITKSATVTIAAPVVVVPEVKTTIVGVTKALRVRVENAKGEEVEIVVNGRTVAVATAGTNSKLWVLKATKGKKSVKVYVDGDLVAVKTVTVK
jgi:protocatechuate 3,4-dioxygenase beta subunit